MSTRHCQGRCSTAQWHARNQLSVEADGPHPGHMHEKTHTVSHTCTHTVTHVHTHRHRHHHSLSSSSSSSLHQTYPRTCPRHLGLDNVEHTQEQHCRKLPAVATTPFHSFVTCTAAAKHVMLPMTRATGNTLNMHATERVCFCQKASTPLFTLTV